MIKITKKKNFFVDKINFLRYYNNMTKKKENPMSELKNKLDEMEYDIEAVIDPESLKKITGGNDDNTETDDPCKSRAITGDKT
jgi:hypothetical protein